MENAIVKKSFVFNSVKIRTAIIDGEPWFVAKDVCDVLGLENSRKAVADLEEDERITVTNSYGNPRAGNPLTFNAINESGLYALIFKSRKPEAKAFRKWVTSEVLPSIRKTGGYTDMIPKDLPTALRAYANEVEKNQKLLAENNALQESNNALQKSNLSKSLTIAHNKPKVLFADAVSASNTSILVGDLAKILKQNGVNTGQNRLFEWMRENGYLIKKGRADYNMPTQKSMNAGLFEIKESVVNNPDGSIRVTKTPKVTGTGQVFFINQFLRSKKVILP